MYVYISLPFVGEYVKVIFLIHSGSLSLSLSLSLSFSLFIFLIQYEQRYTIFGLWTVTLACHYRHQRRIYREIHTHADTRTQMSCTNNRQKKSFALQYTFYLLHLLQNLSKIRKLCHLCLAAAYMLVCTPSEGRLWSISCKTFFIFNELIQGWYENIWSTSI